MLLALRWQDHMVIVVYIGLMLLLGCYLARRQTSGEEYFLGGRRMPWFAVGVSVIASLLSSLTYLSEPAEVWNAGLTQFLGKMLAIPVELLVVFVFFVPFLMRFRFTSAYEYLEHRFGRPTRLLGMSLFVLMVVLWMGFIVTASARALATVSGMDVWVVIATVGVVATLYTFLGGLRAVVWTDVVQVLLLVGGGVFAIAYVAITTQSWVPDWYASTTQWLAEAPRSAIAPVEWFSLDPHVRATVITVAVSMAVWHLCTHVGNQMTVQRYFSTRNARAARRSFVTGALLGAGLNAMLMLVGLALLYYYFELRTYGPDGTLHIPLDGQLDALQRSSRDLIFPTFAVSKLPPGMGGAILAALLAAAMSSIDSGINSIATVISVEFFQSRPAAPSEPPPEAARAVDHRRLQLARWITLAAGLLITTAAYGLSLLPPGWGIVDAMPRTFNTITPVLGGLFIVGMFVPFARQGAMLAAAVLGLLTSLTLGFWASIAPRFHALGWFTSLPARDISPTWIMPVSLAVVIASAVLLGPIDPSPRKPLRGLTWWRRHEPPLCDPPPQV